MISWLKWLLGHVKAWFQVFMGVSDSETLQLYMDDFPITASLGPIDRLISQLQSLEGSKHNLPVDLSANQIGVLTKHLREFRSPMKKLSEMEDTTFIDKWWMKEVRELCYDTEDYMEEVMMQYCAGAPRAWIPVRLQLGRIAGNIIYWIHGKLKWRLQLSHFLARAEVLKGRCPSPVYKENADDISLNKEIKPDFTLDKENRADIENLSAQLVEMLDFQDKQIQLKVVPIYGLTGAGKTMLVRALYAKYKRRFHCWAFVRVSRNPDIRFILTSILSQIKAPLPSPPLEVQDLIVSISRHLNKKRYFIVVDDIRRTSVWHVISRALPADRCGSRIIMTTESEHVASACSGYYLGSTILKMDALTACTDTITSKDINLRYNNLPLHLRTCLLFLSMYPEGWTSMKDDLVKQWIAEGFIPALKSQEPEQISEIPTNKTEEIAEVPQYKRDDISDILQDQAEEIAELPQDQTCEIAQTNQDQREEIARGYFDELVTCGMIQPVDINHNGEVLSCTVHHMVLDLIRYKSKEENFIVVVDNLESTLGHPDIVRRLSVQFGCEKGASIPESIILSQVRSLTFYGFHECAPSIGEYGLLRVLILNTWADEDKIFDLTRIGDLYHLIYLKIECNITVRLPSTIRRLQHLCTLELHAEVVALPSDIGHLKKLTHVRCPSEADVKYLGDLTSLLDLQLTCSTVQNLEDNMKRLHSVMEKLSSLRCLAMVPASGSCSVNTLPANLSRMYISCDSLCILSHAPANLVRLELSRYCCIFSRVPRWIGELHQLCILKIAVRELSREDIDILRGLPALTTLSLHAQPMPAEKIVFGKEGFSVLRYFKLTCTVPWLEFEAGAIPNLEKLKLCFNSPIVDEQGTTRTIIIGRLLGLKEFSAIIGSGVDAESAWWKAIRNDPRNPEVQLTGMIYYGDKDGYNEEVIRVEDGAVEPEWRAAESGLKDAIPLHSKLHNEVNVKRAEWIEEEYGSTENQHLIQEKHPSSDQLGKIKEDSDEDIKQNSDNESASTVSSFPHLDTKKKESISSAQLLVAMALSEFNEYAEVLSNINACREFFSWTASGIKTAIRYRHNIMNLHDEKNHNTINLHDEENIAAQRRIQEEIEHLDAKLGHLKDGLWKLKTTMPKMLDLIDRVEFQSHKQQAAALLPDIKDLVYDAEDLLDEFDYYALKLKVDCSKYSGQDHLVDTFMEFLARVGSNDYIREVNRIQEKLDHIHLQSKDMGLHKAPRKFDKLVRPGTDYNLNGELHGRKKELKQLLEKLGVHEQKRGRTVSKARMTELPVLSIVGMGGVGKTTMAQQICKTQGRHFDCTIWTCVSDDFDVKVLTKEIIEGLKGDASSNNLDILMRELERLVKSKKFLLVVDDMWDGILKDNGAKWKRLCAPLKKGAEGSRILVTTRFLKVAELVGPDNHYELNGLQDAVFWDFFKLCAFGSKPSCSNQDQEALECIGQKIVPKLKGSPLAAKTIGCILGMDLSTTHWENIMGRELWQVEQDETDILPALRLSYLYLPQKLKRCFSICAMYPKDHKFDKDMLADIWIAQGYVVGPKEASLCFDALANRSFFQKASPTSITKYVIHDLMHDTAQLISKDECFIIKHASDLHKVPSNVRHLSIFTNKDFRCSELKIICKNKKLRSLICNESYSRAEDFDSVIDCWFKELSKLRLLSFKVSNVPGLPESIGNSKHLRYLCLLGKTTFNNFPSAVCDLHQLKVINCGSCSIERFPSEFTGAISLQRIKSKNFTYDRDQSDKLCLKWFDQRTGVDIKENRMEALPHWDVQHLQVEDYEGESCPSWLHPNHMPRLRSLEFHRCNKIKSIPFFVPSDGSHDNAAGSVGCNRLEEFVVAMCEQIDWQGSIVLPTSLTKIRLRQPGHSMDHFVSCFVDLTALTCLEIFHCESLTSIPLHIWRRNLPSLAELTIQSCDNLTSISISGASNSSSNSSEGGSVNGFSSLAKIRVKSCGALLSLEEFLTPDCVPVVKDIWVSECGELTSLFFDTLDGLQELHISCCSKLNPQRVMTFPSSLKRLTLQHCEGIESINLANSLLAALEEVEIVNCKGLRSVGGAAAVHNISRIKGVYINGCPELKEIQQPLIHGMKSWRGSAGVSRHQASTPAGSSSAGGSRDHAAGSGSD